MHYFRLTITSLLEHILNYLKVIDIGKRADISYCEKLLHK